MNKVVERNSTGKKHKVPTTRVNDIQYKGDLKMILFTIEKISDEGNAYGFNRIDIIALNYDGNGGAIARNNDSETLDY